jgi:hypothetical protein
LTCILQESACELCIHLVLFLRALSNSFNP